MEAVTLVARQRDEHLSDTKGPQTDGTVEGCYFIFTPIHERGQHCQVESGEALSASLSENLRVVHTDGEGSSYHHSHE